MQTLSFGYKKPDAGDVGSLFFPALEADIIQLNSHDHDGVDSALIASHNVVAGMVTAQIADWVVQPNGLFRQLITAPTGWDYDNSIREYRLTSGDVFYPTVVRVTATTFYLYINDNTQTVLVIFR